MSIDEKADSVSSQQQHAVDHHGTNHDDAATYQRPTGLKGLYSHPKVQIALLGLVCFMGPGLFNALNGLGAGGQVDSATSANSNSALYATFAVSAFFAGSINNVLGPKLTLIMGSTGYSLYIASYLAMNINASASGFVIAAGAILGICAGLLWTAQGSIMLSYPTESEKGQSIYIFWSIFNLGGVVGGAVAFGANFNTDGNSVGNGTYIGFLVLTIIGIAIPLAMINPKNMRRTDGSRVTSPRHPSWKTEIIALKLALVNDPMILLLFPMFLASNWFYTWQFNAYNGALFNIRTRSLNSMVYWASQVVGSISIGLLLDAKNFSRRTRAFAGWSVLLIMIFVTHTWGYFYQKEYTRESIESGETPKMDFSDSGYAAKVWLYLFFGIVDAQWQSAVYWLMGAMSNDPAKLAYFSGFYKAIQSAGAAGIWRADGIKVPYMNIFLSTWGLTVAGLLFALPMIHLRVKNTTDLADETIARLDDTGAVRDVQEVQHEIGHTPAHATRDTEKV
ncbi:MFS general substrate transporter [Pterulicium gracile]|uniref:MFS general substrate transporter n=1 Tax=Pterulicium gracile TaxID=1884261 RepID=A0A5C3QJT7_9AGAR|nr:MFS general substrate transporter [Pterula gracilis]